MTNANRARPRRAFTLIEVLVVIAVIALLLSLLLPSLGRAREVGRQTKCSIYMRSIMQASLMYGGEYKDILPRPNWQMANNALPPALPPGTPVGYNPLNNGWLYDEADRQREAALYGTTYQWLSHRTGLLWKLGFLTADENFRCPSHRGPYTKRGYPEGNFSLITTSYLMNGATASFPAGSDGRTYRHFRIDRYIPQAVMFWETSTANGAGVRAPWVEEDWGDGSSSPDQGLNDRHDRGSNLVLIDASVRWHTTQQYNDYVFSVRFRPGYLWCVPGLRDGGASLIGTPGRP